MVKLRFFRTLCIIGQFPNHYQYRACYFSACGVFINIRRHMRYIIISIGLKFSYFIYSTMVKLRFFCTLCITGQFVKLSFNTEDITYPELWIEIKFQFRNPVSSTSRRLSKILSPLLFHGQVLFYRPCVSQVNFLIITNMELVMSASMASS